MARRPIWLGWLGLAAGFGILAPAAAPTQGPLRLAASFAPSVRAGLFRHRSSAREAAAAQVPLQELPPDIRAQVQHVVERPTLFTQGPAETFTCYPALYEWFLEHPDQTVHVWRRLGAKCMEVQNRSSGVFGWTDGQGSDVRWWTVHKSPTMRIWYAEGQARVAGILPLVPVKAVVVLRHDESTTDSGRTMIQHQSDMFMYTDSKTAALITRLLGPTAPHLAEQCAGQMQMFFSALAWYLDQHPVRARSVLTDILPADAAQWDELRQRARTPRPAGSVPPATMTRYGS